MNRKNALFAGSDVGGDNWVVIATLENCKITGINPHTWLTTTLTALANGHPANRVDELMRWTAVACEHRLRPNASCRVTAQAAVNCGSYPVPKVL